MAGGKVTRATCDPHFAGGVKDLGLKEFFLRKKRGARISPAQGKGTNGDLCVGGMAQMLATREGTNVEHASVSQTK